MRKLTIVLLLAGLALEAHAQPKRVIRRGPGGPGGAEVTKDWPKITAVAAGDAAIAPGADAYLKSLAARDLFSGTVLIARGGEPVFVHSYGLADREARVANADGTRYNIGSITKTMTKVALLLLRDEGRLDFAKTLRTYLPDYPSKIADQVTLQQLDRPPLRNGRPLRARVRRQEGRAEDAPGLPGALRGRAARVRAGHRRPVLERGLRRAGPGDREGVGAELLRLRARARPRARRR